MINRNLTRLGLAPTDCLFFWFGSTGKSRYGGNIGSMESGSGLATSSELLMTRARATSDTARMASTGLLCGRPVCV